MIKKLAFALSLTTICTQIYPTYSQSQNEILDKDSLSRIRVKKIVNVQNTRTAKRSVKKEIQPQQKIKIARKRMNIQRTSNAPKMRFATRLLMPTITAGPKVGMVRKRMD